MANAIILLLSSNLRSTMRNHRLTNVVILSSEKEYIKSCWCWRAIRKVRSCLVFYFIFITFNFSSILHFIIVFCFELNFYFLCWNLFIVHQSINQMWVAGKSVLRLREGAAKTPHHLVWTEKKWINWNVVLSTSITCRSYDDWRTCKKN